jgi:hypothetical protein
LTEAEWDSTDKAYLLWPLLTASRKRGAASIRNRKFRLIACALCRDAWQFLTDDRSRRAVEVAERFADGQASAGELEAAKNHAWLAYCEGVGRRREATLSDRLESNCALADHAAGWVANKDAKGAARTAASAVGWVRHHAADPARIWTAADLIRETFGNPFRPVALDAAWLTPTVRSVALAASEERLLPSGKLDANLLAVLADALEEARCDETTILGHLRGARPHVRGCFAVDGLLGRS